MAAKQFVVFLVNGEEYGIEVTAVNGILRYKNYKIKKLPTVPAIIEGVINLRGKVNYIYNLNKMFAHSANAIDPESKIMMVYAAEQTVGYIVDEVTDIVHIDEADIEPAPASISSIQGEYISGIGKLDERLIIMLDIEKTHSR
ncbi:MAG: chemotaxis protein CheW [Pelosinus sp.]|nr:chemotaxis protein CheW [Pelosinus sp.]